LRPLGNIGNRGDFEDGKFCYRNRCCGYIIVDNRCNFTTQVRKIFFTKDISRLDFEETNKVIKENIERSKEWILRSDKDFNETYKQAGKGDLPFRLREYKIGNPDHSSRVSLAFPSLSTFMPAAIAVVEYKDGQVTIYRKNTRLMGYCFTGVVKEIMTKEVPKGLDEILEGVI